MERKYYLRGLGLGIAMTAIIMGVALSGNKTMTDEKIISRAKELGMVENTVLSDGDNESGGENAYNADVQDDGQQEVAAAGQNLPTETGQDSSAEQNMPVEEEQDGVSDAGTDAEDAGTDAEDADETDTEDADEKDADVNHTASDIDSGETKEETDKPEENVNEIITSAAVKTITVKSGDGSYTVAKKLADVGVVTSAETFDTFLCQNGYDKRLRTGTFSIPADASDEQIARIVTGAE